jgi:zinc/manganese transport system substrate-binding protein
MLKITRRLVLAGLVAFAAPSAALAQDKLPVVATFSILGDFVAQVGGDRIALTTLVGPNGDGHVYSPKPVDARRVAEAKIVFANGLKFEGWINRLIRSSGTKATVIEATKGITPLKTEEEAHGHGHSHGGHDHGAFDPHAWQSVANAKIYVANIRDGLSAADPAGAATYAANATAYLAKLDALEAEVKAAVARVPEGARKVITSHDAFAYFEAAYGIEFLSPQGVSTEAEATARQVARLIQQIRKDNVRALFVETVTDPRLIKRIADETGVKVGGEIYSDALSDASGPAATYIDMVRHNTNALVAAMLGS